MLQGSIIHQSSVVGRVQLELYGHHDLLHRLPNIDVMMAAGGFVYQMRCIMSLIMANVQGRSYECQKASEKAENQMAEGGMEWGGCH